MTQRAIKEEVYSSELTRYVSQDILSNEDTTSLLEDLEPDTLYDVSITAIYPDESESEDLLGSQRTCKQPQNPHSKVEHNVTILY